MKNHWYIWYVALSICSYLESSVEIENKSSMPFMITHLVLEQNNGLHKTPQSNFEPIIIHPHSTGNPGPRKMITELTGIHAGKTYTFRLSPYNKNIIFISNDNEIMTKKPSIPSEYRLDDEIFKNFKPIRRL